MNKFDYNGSIHQRYNDARRLLLDTGILWMNKIREFVKKTEGISILDLGSGTGRFTVLLADELQAHVFGVEPSEKMRMIAMKEHIHNDVQYFQGSAEKIPFENEKFDIIWTSMVIHHITKLEVAAKEMHRVIRPNGKLFIRNSFKNRLQSIRFYEFFPTAFSIDNERLPSANFVKSIFEQYGFKLVRFEPVQQVIDKTFHDHVERIRKRGISTFELISDKEFSEGLRLMEKAEQTENNDSEVTEKIDLMVFSRVYS